MGRGYVLTMMEVDEREHVDEDKSPPTIVPRNLQLCGQSLPLSDYHVLDWFEAHEDTASQWTEDA